MSDESGNTDRAGDTDASGETGVDAGAESAETDTDASTATEGEVPATESDDGVESVTAGGQEETENGETGNGTSGDEERVEAVTLSRLVGQPETASEDADWRVDPNEAVVDERTETQVSETEPATVAQAIATLREERDRLAEALDEQRERADDLESRLARKQADFQNYKKRQKERLEEETERATEDLVARLLDVRDSLQRALDQEEGTDIRGGVETTLEQFDEQLARENVEQVEPAPGEPVDPQRHEALATVESGQPADTIADVHRPGYEMAGKLLRPAQVTVSDGSGADSADDQSDKSE
jgi:molecular chaperone GrpE